MSQLNKLTVLFITSTIDKVETAIAMGETLVGAADGAYRAVILTDYKLRDKLYAKHPTIRWIVTDISDGEGKESDTKSDEYYGAGLSSVGAPDVSAKWVQKLDPLVDRALIEFRPAVIVVDSPLDLPSIARSGVPWILVNSSQSSSPPVNGSAPTQTQGLEIAAPGGQPYQLEIHGIDGLVDDSDMSDKLTDIGKFDGIDEFPKLIEHITGLLAHKPTMLSVINDQNDRRYQYVSALTVRTLVYEKNLFSNLPYSCIRTLRHLTIRPADVWLCGYPKSGNTWLSEIVALVMADGVVDRVPDIWDGLPGIYRHCDDYVDWYASRADPRLESTHICAQYLPLSVATVGKVIYIVRNPKDVCVSYYWYHKNLVYMSHLADTQWPDFCHLFLAGHLWLSDWFANVSSYWLKYGSGRANPRILFVAYEELVVDLPAMVRTIARFLGKDFTAEIVDTIAAHCSLDSMRANPLANRSAFMAKQGKPSAQFIRKGTIGDWSRHMTDEQSAMFDETYGQRLRAIGLPVCDTMADAQSCMATNGRIITMDNALKINHDSIDIPVLN